MKIFDSNLEVLKRSLPAKISKRFVCCVIDMILVIFVAGTIFTLLFAITKNTSSYKYATETINHEIEYYNRFTSDTHIVEYVDGERVSGDVLVFKNICRAIVHSYNIFGNSQQPNFKFNSDHDVLLNGEQSLVNDNIAYFYTQYLPSNCGIQINFANKNLFEVYKNAFGNDAVFMFTFDSSISDVPVLNTQVAYYLFHYLFIDETDNIGETGASYYEAYYNAYTFMLEEAEMKLLQSEPYYSTHYLKYKDAYCSQARYTNITLIISIFISCMIVLLIPKFLFKNEQTIGYKLFGLGVINFNNKTNQWYVIVIKTIIESFGFILTAFILYLFPPYSGNFEAMFIPISNYSNVSFALILLIIGVISCVVNVFGLFTFNRQNLLNLFFNDRVVDIHYIDDSSEQTNHGRLY